MLSATILVGGLRVYLRVYENLHAKKKKKTTKKKKNLFWIERLLVKSREDVLLFWEFLL